MSKEAVVFPDLPPGFVSLNSLGSGEFARVDLCAYSGDNPEIRQLCDSQGRVALKRLYKPDDREVENSRVLMDSVNSNPSLNGKFLLAAQVGDNASIIASRPTLYDPVAGCGSDLLGFMKSINNHPRSKPLQADVINAFNSHVGITVSQLINSMRASQTALHDAGVLHLDSAMRNFLVNPITYNQDGSPIFGVTIIDYGISSKFSDGVSVKLEGQILTKAPVTLLDGNALAYREGTTTTDIFGRMATSHSLCGMVLGAMSDNAVIYFEKSTKDIESFGPHNIMGKREFVLARRDGEHEGDSLALNTYLDNVETLAGACYDEKKQREMTFFLESYKEYLTTVPPPTATREEAHQADYNLLMKANAKFMMKVFEAELQHTDLQNPEQVKALSVLARRLDTIETNDEFKKSEFYQRFSTFTATSELKATQSELFGQVSKAEEIIKSQLGSHKWVFVSGESMGNHPRALLAQTLRAEVNQLKTDIREGKVTSSEAIDESIKGMRERITQTSGQKSESIPSQQSPSVSSTSSKQESPAPAVAEDSTPRFKR